MIENFMASSKAYRPRGVGQLDTCCTIESGNMVRRLCIVEIEPQAACPAPRIAIHEIELQTVSGIDTEMSCAIVGVRRRRVILRFNPILQKRFSTYAQLRPPIEVAHKGGRRSALGLLRSEIFRGS